MFRRRKEPPTVTNDGFRRWLRAHRPPWAFFFTLGELEQEQLAVIGDQHAQDFAVAVGYAVADPQLAESGIAASEGDVEAEVTLAKRLAASFASRILQRREPPATPAPKAATWAGIGARRVENVVAAPRRMFGKEST